LFGGTKDTLAQLAARLAELYKEIVTTTVQFDELRRYTKESLDEFKRLLERQSDKIDRIERERITAEAELTARIRFLEGRLDVLSEKALHIAVADIAAGYVKRGGDGEAVKRLTDGS
jgi:seryl-tRNA synthetase